MKKLRLAAVSAVGALAASAGLMFPATAQAAPTYWQFQNAGFGTCLTAGDTGTAFATSCVGSNRQQWDWVGANGNFAELRNRETGTCLMTDNKSSTNAVWMSSCTGAAGQWWRYAGDSGAIFDNLGAANEGFLRTSHTHNAVYATDLGQQPEADVSFYVWWGTHD
ncbi:RICIN domain-containing protein [Streptomyces xylophagus]|uniref:RICIN domain-containing protein n=1 Tax=Streptomyces xylophagus TaxID=285514 RepID=UPI0005BA565F|nr:RICIN domain-containing protein [Streptomyces xylophagus]